MRHNNFRILYMILAGILLAFVMKQTIYDIPQDHPLLYDYLVTILITVIVWEGNLRIDSWLNRNYSWVLDAKKRFLIQFFVAMIFSAIVIYAIMLLYHYITCCGAWEKRSLMLNSFYIGLAVSFILLTFEVSAQFFNNWKQSLIEVEKYKTQSAQAQLQNLKDQINPHFLFNNLSVLSSLVYKNQDKAVDFINQLSKVYRYLLDNKNLELVTLEEEMTFLRSYIYLLSIRFEDSLKFDIQIDETLFQKTLPPMTLQMLVENAIKHNEVSSALPLVISIHSGVQCIRVFNHLQKRNMVEGSSKTGLKNIQARYAFMTEEAVIIEDAGDTFSVTIPLLQHL